MVVTVINYDDATGIATFRTPDGLTRTAVVPPNLRTLRASRAARARASSSP